jgi:two-component system CheB/CheR fusion protein
MYFNSDAQSRILARFHFALAEHGILFLGKAEMLLTHSALFAPLDLRRRIFRKVAKDDWRERLAIMTQTTRPDGDGLDGRNTILPSAFDVSPTPQFIIDGNGLLAMFNDRAKTLFAFVPTDIGRPFQDLEVSYRPAELRPVVADVVAHHGPATMRDVQWDGPGQNTRFVDIHLVPVHDAGGRVLGVSVSFTDVSRVQELQMQLHRSRQDLETAYEELQSTNEELETTNEELQSTVEELETTNEELQSTNEELETMNEELQSTNEELQTMNEELRERSEDSMRANSFLESILTGVRNGVVVVDRELRVIAWNNRSEELWGLRADEVRLQNFLNLDIGLPTDQLRLPIRECLNGVREQAEANVQATTRRGKTIACKVTVSPLVGSERDIRGAILLMDEEPIVVSH